MSVNERVVEYFGGDDLAADVFNKYALRDVDGNRIEALPTDTFRREVPEYPSCHSTGGGGHGTKKESPKYTGTLVKGIATMHKSNAVPIMNQKEATEISEMAR